MKRKFLTSISYQRTEGVYQIDAIILCSFSEVAASCSMFDGFVLSV